MSSDVKAFSIARYARFPGKLHSFGDRPDDDVITYVLPSGIQGIYVMDGKVKVVYTSRGDISLPTSPTLAEFEAEVDRACEVTIADRVKLERQALDKMLSGALGGNIGEESVVVIGVDEVMDKKDKLN